MCGWVFGLCGQGADRGFLCAGPGLEWSCGAVAFDVTLSLGTWYRGEDVGVSVDVVGVVCIG